MKTVLLINIVKIKNDIKIINSFFLLRIRNFSSIAYNVMKKINKDFIKLDLSPVRNIVSGINKNKVLKIFFFIFLSEVKK